jgi:cytoskeletal protein CcmA (bactofilin family)
MRNTTISILDQQIFVKGSIFSLDAIDILGVVSGIIIANRVFIKNSAIVMGDIFSNGIVIIEGGKFTGNIYASFLKINKNAVIENSNIFYDKIAIEDGAIINANVTRISKQDVNVKIEENQEFMNFVNKIRRIKSKI